MNRVKKQRGFILTTELIILATIMTIGSVIGFAIVRDTVVAELLDIADSIEAEQHHAFDGAKNSSAIMNNYSSDGLIWLSPGAEGSVVVFDNTSSRYGTSIPLD